MKHSGGDTIYESYLDGKIDLNKVDIVLPFAIQSKPQKGLWGSREDAGYSWRDWCIAENFTIGSIKNRWKVKQNAKILECHSEQDILPYVNKENRYKDFGDYWLEIDGRKNYTCGSDILNLDKLYEDYDGVEVFLTDDYGLLHDGIFYFWDVDSICVWNKDVIEILE